MSKEIFDQIQKEAKDIHNEILSICEKNEKIKELYKGCQIYFSPISNIPVDVMFLGINPGQGFYSHNNNQLVEKYEPLEKHEYIEHSYTLADSWREIFEKDLNRIDLLENSFKTNFYFWATKGEKELESFLGELNKVKEKFGDKIVFKSVNWIKSLILELSPRVLIVEGKFAFKELKRCFSNKELEMYNEYEGYINGLDCYVFCTTRCYSNMKNTDNVIEFLQGQIEQGLIGKD